MPCLFEHCKNPYFYSFILKIRFFLNKTSSLNRVCVYLRCWQTKHTDSFHMLVRDVWYKSSDRTKSNGLHFLLLSGRSTIFKQSPSILHFHINHFIQVQGIYCDGYSFIVMVLIYSDGVLICCDGYSFIVLGTHLLWWVLIYSGGYSFVVMGTHLLWCVLICSDGYSFASRGGTFGWGTALKAGRSRFRFPMMSRNFSLT